MATLANNKKKVKSIAKKKKLSKVPVRVVGRSSNKKTNQKKKGTVSVAKSSKKAVIKKKQTVKKKADKKTQPKNKPRMKIIKKAKKRITEKLKKVIVKTRKSLSVKKKKTLSRSKKTTPFATGKPVPFRLEKHHRNPILEPRQYAWESQAAFNPGAVEVGGKVHLFYRALGNDGVSRIGYASSDDGVNFVERLTYPVFVAEDYQEAKKHWPFTSPGRLTYNTSVYASGGGWGGCEDPRVTLIDGVIYMTFNMFNGWNSMRVAVTSISEENLLNKKWVWNNFAYLSKANDRQKNWVLFPEKINGKYALFYNLDKGDPNRVYIKYMNELCVEEAPTSEDAPDPQKLPDHHVAWHYRTRSAACPPIKTKDGWLLLYHAMDKKESMKYKVGAMLLDLKDPTLVLHRAPEPILEPDAWYENDWKPGIVYANGAVVRDGILYVYYGGGDKHVAVASVPMKDLINNLKQDKTVKLKKEKSDALSPEK